MSNTPEVISGANIDLERTGLSTVVTPSYINPDLFEVVYDGNVWFLYKAAKAAILRPMGESIIGRSVLLSRGRHGFAEVRWLDYGGYNGVSHLAVIRFDDHGREIARLTESEHAGANALKRLVLDVGFMTVIADAELGRYGREVHLSLSQSGKRFQSIKNPPTFCQMFNNVRKVDRKLRNTKKAIDPHQLICHFIAI